MMVSNSANWRKAVKKGKYPIFKGTYLAGAEEHLGHTELEVVVVQAQRLEERLAEGAGIKLGEGRGQDLGVEVVQILEGGARREAALHEVEHGHHACALQLRENLATRENLGLHLLVGLDAANEGRAGAAQLLHEQLEGRLELGADGDECDLSALGLLLASLKLEERAGEGILGAVHELSKIGREGIVVLVQETISLVADGTGEMADDESLVIAKLLVVGHLGLARHLETEVVLMRGVELLGELGIAGLGNLALLVEDGKDASSLS